jgi:hypothetical protein
MIGVAAAAQSASVDGAYAHRDVAHARIWTNIFFIADYVTPGPFE